MSVDMTDPSRMQQPELPDPDKRPKHKPPRPVAIPVGPVKTDDMAVASLVCAIVSVVICITAPLAVIFGHISLSNIRKNPNLTGRGLAITGLVIGYLEILLAVLFVALFVFAAKRPTADSSGPASHSLTDDRSAHRTRIVNPVDFGGEPAPVPPAGRFERITYTSPAGELSAYLTPDPGDGNRHPAVVWAHGGFGGIDSWFWEPAPRDNDQTAGAFREAGIVLMLPSWRGENDNPGQFELFYGEVDDLVAAIGHVRKLPWVDPDRVYVAGHSTGGTLTLLAAVSTDTFRAAFSFGGAPDLYEVVSDGKGYGNTPYDYSDRRESELRSASRYAGDIERPTFYFEGSDSSYPAAARRMQRNADRAAAPLEVFILSGYDHFNILAPVTGLIAKKILEDTGDACNIAFSDGELYEALKAKR